MSAPGPFGAPALPRHAPLLVTTRSGFAENVHVGSLVCLDAVGAVSLAVGDVEAPVLPRSATKPAQAVAALRCGLDLDGELLALACSSHSGEPFHLDGVRHLLAGADLTEDALQTPPDLPLGDAERLAWRCRGTPPSRVAHNCSGKHAAMLAASRASGWDVAGYRDPSHPVQRAAADVLAELAGAPVAATAVDGCGAPALAIPLVGLARVFARIATAEPGGAEHRVATAVRDHPDRLGGTGRDVTRLLEAVPGLVAKDGADGVYAAALPDGRAVALKVADGSSRARRVALVAALRVLGVHDVAGARHDVLDALAAAPVLGHGEPVGALVPAGWAAAPRSRGTGARSSARRLRR